MNYLVFAGQDYYPGRGWENFVRAARTLDDALEIAASATGDWWQVVELETFEVLREGQRQ